MKNFRKFIHEWVFVYPFVNKRGKSNHLLIWVIATFLSFSSLSTFAQSKSITLNANNTSLSQVLKKVKEQSDYTFFYSNDLVKNKTVSVSLKKEDISSAMTKILTGTGIAFKIEASRIVLFADNSEKDKKKKTTIKVFDLDQKPLPGATIAFANSGKHAVTNIEGEAAAELHIGERIKITFIGFKTYEALYHGQKELVVNLNEDSKHFEEVVITGYSTVSKERSTGSVTTLKSEDLTKNLKLNMTSSLEGQVAGLSTYKGALAIRGTTTLKASNQQVLVVVDGLPIEGGIDNINPNDVESINILKDAASASIYGTRAANGIIVVTTKSGKDKKASYNFSYNLSITPKYRVSNYKLASTSDIIDYERYCLENDPVYTKSPSKYFTDKNANFDYYSPVHKLYSDEILGVITHEEKEKAIAELKKYDYRKEFEKLFFRNSVTQQYNLSILKGGDKSSIAFSTIYQRSQNGTVGDNSESIKINLKNTFSLNSKIELSYGVYGNFIKSESPLNIGSELSELPYQRIINDDNSRYQITKINYKHNENLVQQGLYSMTYNPLDEADAAYSKNVNSQFRGFADLKIKILEGVKYNAKFQYEKYFNKNESTYRKDSYYMRNLINQYAVVNKDNTIKYYMPNNGNLTTTQAETDNFTYRNQIDVKYNLFDKILFESFAGTEYRQYLLRGLTSEIYGYDPVRQLNGEPVNWDALNEGIYGALSPNVKMRQYTRAGSSYNLNRDFSLYLNGSLSYNNKYTIAGSWRVDKTNLFGVEARNKNLPLWSISGSWNASSEEFMRKIEWVDNLKIRASFGANGNVDRTSSPFMIATSIKDYNINDYYTSIPTPPNKQLRWEKTEIFNTGIDFTLFKRRLNGSVDFYNKYTTDLLASKVLDYTTGYDKVRLNNGEMRNKGVEVSIGYDFINNDIWNVNSRIVFAYNKNTVEKINYNPTEARYLTLYSSEYYRNGDPYNSLYSYRYAGTTTNGDPSVYDKLGNVVENNKKMTDPDALVYSGLINPPITGSFNQSVRYKNFELDLSFVLYAGHKLRRDVTPLYSHRISGGNYSQDILNRWTPENKNSTIPRFPDYSASSDRSNFWKYADIHVVSADMVKLRNASITYNLNPQILSKLHMKSLQVKLQVNNAWFWSAAGNGIDPENYDPVYGVRSGYGTNVPTFLLGANITF